MNKRKKTQKWTKIFICAFTFLNLLLSLIIRLYDRKQIIKAVNDDGTVKAFLVTEKTTKKM